MRRWRTALKLPQSAGQTGPFRRPIAGDADGKVSCAMRIIIHLIGRFNGQAGGARVALPQLAGWPFTESTVADNVHAAAFSRPTGAYQNGHSAPTIHLMRFCLWCYDVVAAFDFVRPNRF